MKRRPSQQTGSASGASGPFGGPGRLTDDAGFGLVEALIAFVILSVGLMAVAGIALSVAAQTRDAAGTTARSLAGQQVLAVTASAKFSEVPLGAKDTTITVGNRTFTVTRTVDDPSPRTKKVTVEVPGTGSESEEVMVTYLHQPIQAPSAP